MMQIEAWEVQANLMVARYYSSSLARFMAVDPGDDTALEDPQSWNKYAYVGNNPINATDPTGEASTKQKILVAAAVVVAVADGPLPIGDVAASLIIATAMTLEGPKPPAPDGKPDDAPKPDAGADKKDDGGGSKKAKDRRAEEQEADKSQRRGAPDWEPPASDREGKDGGKDVEKEAGGGDKGKDARRQYHDEKGPGGDRTKKELKEDKKIVQPKPNP